jgi:hypothetical protein
VAFVFRQEIFEVVAGDAARQVRIAAADLVAILVAQRFQPAINLAAPSALADDALQLVLGGFADTHTQTVVGENLQLVRVVGGAIAHAVLDGQQRMSAARVVAEHPA